MVLYPSSRGKIDIVLAVTDLWRCFWFYRKLIQVRVKEYINVHKVINEEQHGLGKCISRTENKLFNVERMCGVMGS